MHTKPVRNCKGKKEFITGNLIFLAENKFLDFGLWGKKGGKYAFMYNIEESKLFLRKNIILLKPEFSLVQASVINSQTFLRHFVYSHTASPLPKKYYNLHAVVNYMPFSNRFVVDT